MFIRHDTYTTANPICNKLVELIDPLDFRYFDKDGFELNVAEQKFYSAMNYPIYENILNHTCWQVPWISLPQNSAGLFLDHAMVLQRCKYTEHARTQIEIISQDIPAAQFLLQIRPKWGYDFDLNGIAPDGTVYEVLHVEYDVDNYDQFLDRVIHFEQIIKHTDWVKAAEEIWNSRSEWGNLHGFEQNHWKANHILGWKQAEYLEKAIT